MRRLAVILALLLLLNVLPSTAEPDGGKYTYIYEVEETGWTHITIKFEGKAAGRSWLLVPKFREYKLKVLSGRIFDKKIINETEYYFYANFTFAYEDNTVFEMRWSYRFGALIIEPNGVFFSTQIGFSRGDDAEIVVKLPKEFKDLEVEPPHFTFNEKEDFKYITYNLDGAENNTMRVLIAFKVKKAKFLTKKVGNLEIVYPPRYEDLAENVSKYYKALIDEIMDYTAADSELNIKVKFFVPGSMRDILTLGYTGPRYTSDVITPGVVNLNMMLVRMVYTELPNTLTHELLHQYMQYSGLTIDLRWAHEGLAQYLSGIIVRDALGFDGKVEKEFEDAVKFVEKHVNDYSFVVSWKGGGLPDNPYLYYSASLALIYRLAKEYGGPSIYKRFFHKVREDRAKVNTLAKFVYYMNKATGKDVAQFLIRLGIPKEAMVTSHVERMLNAAEQYVNRTRWFNPLVWLAEKILREGSDVNSPDSESLLMEVIFMTFLGFFMEAAVIGLIVSVVVKSKGEDVEVAQGILLEPFGVTITDSMLVTPVDLGVEGEGALSFIRLEDGWILRPESVDVLLNGEKIEETPLKEGDELEVWGVKMRVRGLENPL